MLDLEQPAPALDSTPSNDGNPSPADTELATGLETEQPEPEEIEDELEGVKLRGRKEALEKIKAERLMQADYTRKTQEVAEQRKSFESERETFTRQREAEQALDQKRFGVWAAESRLQQLQQVNLAALRQTNPDLAESLRDELVQLSARLPVAKQALAQEAAALQSESERKRATRANEAEAIVMREVKDWGPEKFKAFIDAGGKAGLQPQDVQRMLVEFPQAARFLDKALKFDQHLAQRLKPKTPEPPPKPATRIGAGAAANTKPLDQVSDPREWAELRRQRKSQPR